MGVSVETCYPTSSEASQWYTITPVADSDHIVPLPTVILPLPRQMTTQMEDCGVTVTNPVSVIWLCVTRRTVDHLQIRCPPKGKWYCPSCRKLAKFNKQKKRNNNAND